MHVSQIIETLRNDWSTPRVASHGAQLSPFRHACVFSANRGENPDVQLSKTTLPKELLNFWKVTESAVLFEDVDYGQWGLKILSPSSVVTATREFMSQRKDEFRQGDIVIGEFLGDADLLLLRCNRKKEDFGMVLVATPIDVREDWYRLELNFENFLIHYANSEGNKFWDEL